MDVRLGVARILAEADIVHLVRANSAELAVEVLCESGLETRGVPHAECVLHRVEPLQLYNAAVDVVHS